MNALQGLSACLKYLAENTGFAFHPQTVILLTVTDFTRESVTETEKVLEGLQIVSAIYHSR